MPTGDPCCLPLVSMQSRKILLLLGFEVQERSIPFRDRGPSPDWTGLSIPREGTRPIRDTPGRAAASTAADATVDVPTSIPARES